MARPERGVLQGSDSRWPALHPSLCRARGQWTLQSGFDGTELLARPGIELVTVEPSAIRQAESKIAGCERCCSESEIPFNWILADALGKHGAFDFILSEPGRCPNCNATLSEKTLVEPQRVDLKLKRTHELCCHFPLTYLSSRFLEYVSILLKWPTYGS
jgi:hypothetical protein